ncbi:MAG: thiol:disulfide interchange protein [Bacteroidetes bacterium]|jgi:thioredoxin-related protein|nr:thiol:disulfide interchange protein [Bacteroidota bacterium]MDF2451518.1 thiol:disulfide interchange protein [Bacteroidota bacterium]
MKASILNFGILSILSVSAVAQTRSIAFEHGTFEEIKTKALKENKLIFIDAFTTWCGPCKQMAKNVFTNDEVADHYNKNFVNAKIDMEKGEGIELAKKYQVQCYPNLLFIDGNGNLVHRIAGSMTAKDFIALAEETKVPEKQFAYYSKNYEANKSNTDFLLKYIEAREATCLQSDEIVKDYFLQQKEEDLTSKANWDMILNQVNDPDSREFKYLVANKKKFEDLYSSKVVDGKIDAVNQNQLMNIIRTQPFNESKYAETKKNIEVMNMPNTKRIFFESDLSLAQVNKDWNSYAKLAIENVDQYYLKDGDALNNIAWTFYEKVEDKEALLKAEAWAKKACELNKTYANLDTYAAVLYKTGKKELALQTANKAIETAKKDNYSADDYKGTTELIEKIKAL